MPVTVEPAESVLLVAARRGDERPFALDGEAIAGIVSTPVTACGLPATLED